ncbi:MAG TPA: FAD/NAD(P)-binding protein [Acidobacteriota bacterium]|nr:FAD/NAD(P)-binding protein [Acidobacteriota bacterium]
MTSRRRDLDLGITREITRRDFVSGASVALSGSLALPWAQTSALASPAAQGASVQALADTYPPARTGLRGSHEGSFEVAHQLVEGTRWDAPEETDEHYDLIVVGAGLSGLAAAWFFHEAVPDARILILDNHDDFGGHAKRNEFWLDGQMHLSHGGTIFIQNLDRYGEAAQRLIRGIGIDVGRYSEFVDNDLYSSLGLRRSVFLDRETFGSDDLLVGEGRRGWRDFLASSPLSERAREDIVRLQESNVDYLAHLSSEQKVEFLQRTSYEDFLLNAANVSREAIAFLESSGGWTVGFDAVPTWLVAGSPGTTGLGLGDDDDRGNRRDRRAFFQFPDGNSSIARLIVRSLIPKVAPGTTMEDIVDARFDYGKLDREGSPVRLRLESTAVRVGHRGDPQSADEVDVTYVRRGRARRVRADRCVLACYNGIIPRLCDELPDMQRRALSSSLKAPLIYTNVLIRNWAAFAKLGVRSVRCPGSYFENVNLPPAISIGSYRHATTPDDPIVVRMWRIPLEPAARGRSVPEQWKAARRGLLATTFETFERNIRDQLGRILSGGGFDPARDIEAITVNRWPHGYAYGQDMETGQVAWRVDEVPPERASWLIARKPFGRIAIANSDAGAWAMTETAMAQAHRAVSELLSEKT